KILNIDHLLLRKPKELSGGERQRVAVGRAIVRNPLVFLFDEPLSNIDAKLRVQMRAELSQLHQRLKTTTFYVTHDQVEAMTLGERIGVMKDGKLLQLDQALKLYNEPVNKFVAGFIGSPPINFLDGTIQNGEKLRFAGTGLNIELPDKLKAKLGTYINQQITLGVRPEDILYQKTEEKFPSFKAELTVIEPMGNETVTYLDIGIEKMLIARLHSQFDGQLGQTLDFYIDTDKIHFFDKTTEIRI
ncbi:MAG: ABC transporter ATP-binding protein, partial [Candidatus Latescibacteria bacterium]|nr:ABC transporter ATP-binding protein [Candidatus Latescibacterota bacterium]